MKLIYLAIVFLVSYAAIHGSGESLETQNDKALLRKEKTDTTLIRESWYFYCALGFGKQWNDYNSSYTSILKSSDNISHFTFSSDLCGFYWHLNRDIIFGYVLNVDIDRYISKQGSGYISYNGYSNSVSAINYFTGFGQGPYVRADLGLNIFEISQKYRNGEGTLRTTESKNEYGISTLLGTGWSFDYEGKRLMLNLNGSFKFHEYFNYQVLGVSVGGMF